MKSRWFEVAVGALALAVVGAFVPACGDAPPSDETSATPGDAPAAVAETESGLTVALYSLRGETLSRGSNRVRLELTAGADRDTTDVDVTLSTFMPAMGHGASEQPELVTTEANRYTFDKVVLNMPGLWELHVGVSGDVEDELVFEFDVE